MNYARFSLLPFFLFSLILHLILIVSWPSPPKVQKIPEPIAVAFLPLPQQSQPKPVPEPVQKSVPQPVRKPPQKIIEKPVQKAEEPSTRPSKAPAQIAKKSTPLPEVTEKITQEIPREKETRKQEPNQRPLKREEFTILQRPLPSLKELLPPPTWSTSRDQSSSREGPVRLDTREPRYITYFSSIKRAIELVWEYPEPALRHGFQGKLVLEFTILENGILQETRLIRSSGFSVLDQEAIRAVRAASPFHPIPSWIGKNRLDIIASFEYLDNRLNYRFAP